MFVYVHVYCPGNTWCLCLSVWGTLKVPGSCVFLCGTLKVPGGCVCLCGALKIPGGWVCLYGNVSYYLSANKLLDAVTAWLAYGGNIHRTIDDEDSNPYLGFFNHHRVA